LKVFFDLAGEMFIITIKTFCKKGYWTVRFYAKKGLTGINWNIYADIHEFNDMAFLLHFKFRRRFLILAQMWVHIHLLQAHRFINNCVKKVAGIK
jgi:hypothetical protein